MLEKNWRYAIDCADSWNEVRDVCGAIWTRAQMRILSFEVQKSIAMETERVDCICCPAGTDEDTTSRGRSRRALLMGSWVDGSMGRGSWVVSRGSGGRKGSRARTSGGRRGRRRRRKRRNQRRNEEAWRARAAGSLGSVGLWASLGLSGPLGP